LDSEKIKKQIEQKIRNSRRINYGTYKYFVWPYKGIEPIDPEEIGFLVDSLEKKIPADTDLVFTLQTDGEILALPLAFKMRKPLMIARDYKYEMEDPMIITQHTRYWTRNLYCERVPQRSRVVIVEALISTGNTVVEVVRQVKDCGAEVVKVVSAVSKTDYGGEKAIKNATNLTPEVLMRVKETTDSAASLAIEWS
jgi:adenine/guanine phosphoribosyltransferase-like PRPP-binding protein